MTTETLTEPTGAYADKPSGARFLRRSARAALVIDAGARRQARMLEGLLPYDDARPRILPGRLLGLDAGDRPAAIPPIDPVIGIEQPENLHAAMIVERMEHHPETGGGVPSSWIRWAGYGSGSVSDSGPYDLPLPPPGQTSTDLHHNLIYQALGIGDCAGGFPFSVGMRSWILLPNEFGLADGDAEIGMVNLFDDSTITQTGLYDFIYEIRAEDGAGRRSRFVVSGSVPVRCTNETSL